MNAGGAVREALAEADRLALEAEERERRLGFPARCRRGCDACCRYLVRLSIPEAAHLRAVVGGLPPERREEVEARFAEVRRILDEAGLREGLEAGLVRERNDPGFEHRVETLARRYLALRIPCPFLDPESRSCSIYPERPAACRQHLVTSDPGLCEDPFSLNARSIPMPRRVRDDLVRAYAAEREEPERMVALPLI